MMIYIPRIFMSCVIDVCEWDLMSHVMNMMYDVFILV